MWTELKMKEKGHKWFRAIKEWIKKVASLVYVIWQKIRFNHVLKWLPLKKNKSKSFLVTLVSYLRYNNYYLVKKNISGTLVVSKVYLNAKVPKWKHTLLTLEHNFFRAFNS